MSHSKKFGLSNQMQEGLVDQKVDCVHQQEEQVMSEVLRGLSYDERIALVQACFEELEREGFLVRTGQYKRGLDGRLLPLYRVVKGKNELEDWTSEV